MGCPNFFKYHPEAMNNPEEGLRLYAKKFGHEVSTLVKAVKQTEQYQEAEKISEKGPDFSTYNFVMEALRSMDLQDKQLVNKVYDNFKNSLEKSICHEQKREYSAGKKRDAPEKKTEYRKEEVSQTAADSQKKESDANEKYSRNQGKTETKAKVYTAHSEVFGRKKSAYDKSNSFDIRTESSTFNTNVSIDHKFKLDEQKYDPKHTPRGEARGKRYASSKQADEKDSATDALNHVSSAHSLSNASESEQKEKYGPKKGSKEPAEEKTKTNEQISIGDIEFAVLSGAFNNSFQINFYESQKDFQETDTVHKGQSVEYEEVKKEETPARTVSADIKNKNYSSIKLEEIIQAEGSAAKNYQQINYSDYTELANDDLHKTLQVTADAAEHQEETNPQKRIHANKGNQTKEQYSEKKERGNKSVRDRAVKEPSEQSRLENLTYREDRLPAPEIHHNKYSLNHNYMKAVIRIIEEIEEYDEKYARYIREKLEEKGYFRKDAEADAKEEKESKKSREKQKKPKKKVKLKKKELEELAKRIEKILKEISRNKKRAASKAEEIVKKIVTKIEKEKEVVNV